jgi:predicted acyl esterase
MRIDWDVPIEMDDGVVLRADVFRPDGDGPCPVLMTHGPYGKGLPFPADRPDATFGGTTTLHAGPDRPSYLLLPVVPPA